MAGFCCNSSAFSAASRTPARRGTAKRVAIERKCDAFRAKLAEEIHQKSHMRISSCNAMHRDWRSPSVAHNIVSSIPVSAEMVG